MKDLIYRLRDWNRTSHERNRVDMLAAADAIEKLEADLAKAQMHIKHIGNDALRAENAALLAANELSVARGLQLLGENTQLKAELAQLRDQKPIGYIYLGGAIDAVGCVVRETAFSGELAIYAAPGANHG